MSAVESRSRPIAAGASSRPYDIAVKTIIIGDSGVGKSSLLYRYSDQDWNPHYIATIGVDMKLLTFERQNKVVKLQLWDTAGQERFRNITQAYYRGAHCVMLVFDLTSHSSFDNVAVWMRDVKKYAIESVPMVLVGNKADCTGAREVTNEEATAMAESLGCKYIETSAKAATAVDSAFEYLVDRAVEDRLEKGKTITRSQQEARGLPSIGSLRERKDARRDDGKCKC